jgi:uncharacterized protein YkwD
MTKSNGLRWVVGAGFAFSVGACAASGNGSGTQQVLPPGQVQGAAGQASGAAGFGASGTTGAAAGSFAGTAGAGAIAGTGAAGMAGATAVAGSGGSAAAGAGGAAGATPTGSTSDPSGCPAAPAGSSAPAIAALAAINALRVPAGSGCTGMVLTLNMSALNHCNYYAGNKATAMCVTDPHGEVMTCMGFTGAGPGARMTAAGYTGRGGGSEVMAFSNNPQSAVAQWINSVWHRIPLLDPWTTELGYGNATGCDVIDLGTGSTGAPTDTVVVYPYDGQTGLPTSFDGSHEGPMPPAPSTGWPSSTPINVYARALVVTEHVLMKDGDTTPLDHMWIDSTTTTVDAGVRGFLRNTAFMYGNAPLAANTKYRVKITGTHTGGALNLEWTFTTGAGGRFGP